MGNNPQLFESIFKKSLFADDTKYFVTELTNEHPYFTAAQFFLLQKTETGSPEYNNQLARTAILFNNPLWLNFQINQFSFPVTSQDRGVPAVNKGNDTFSNVEIEVLEKQQDIKPTDEINFEKDIPEPNFYEDRAVEKMTEAFVEDFPADKTTPTAFATADIIVEPKNNVENNLEQDEKLGEEKETEPITFKLNIIDTATTEDTISFEPLHTSDYFASVGIKIAEEIKPEDKLGKQLKSFTDWLKTMKKIHPDQLPKQSEQSDIIIQQMAEKSNSEGEILTEAMADVLLQQGKSGKAIEVYQKLSLLNPSKSAYFAAKIGQISA
jgi:hypothetical protein